MEAFLTPGRMTFEAELGRIRRCEWRTTGRPDGPSAGAQLRGAGLSPGPRLSCSSLCVTGTWGTGRVVFFFTFFTNKICFIFIPVLFKNMICTFLPHPHFWVVFLLLNRIL